jgi:error-prone DNA polymerase
MQCDPKSMCGEWGLTFVSMRTCAAIANVIITPDLFERERLLVTRSKFILVEGALQNQDGVIHIKAARLKTLTGDALELRSHDFH